MWETPRGVLPEPTLIRFPPSYKRMRRQTEADNHTITLFRLPLCQCLNVFKGKLLVRFPRSPPTCRTFTDVTVVTGSSRGIGAAIAKHLAQDGASVVINYASNEAAAKEVANEINAIRSGAAVIIKADVSTVASCKHLLNETIKAFGRIDILVLNAAVAIPKTLHQVDEEYFDHNFLVNVKAPFFLVQAAEPHLKEGGAELITSLSFRLTFFFDRGKNYLSFDFARQELCNPTPGPRLRSDEGGRRANVSHLG